MSFRRIPVWCVEPLDCVSLSRQLWLKFGSSRMSSFCPMKSPKLTFPRTSHLSFSTCPCCSILRAPKMKPPNRRPQRYAGKPFLVCFFAKRWYSVCSFCVSKFKPLCRKVLMCARSASPSWLMFKRKQGPIPRLLMVSLRTLRTSVTCWDHPCRHWWLQDF